MFTPRNHMPSNATHSTRAPTLVFGGGRSMFDAMSAFFAGGRRTGLARSKRTESENNRLHNHDDAPPPKREFFRSSVELSGEVELEPDSDLPLLFKRNKFVVTRHYASLTRSCPWRCGGCLPP